MRKVKFIEPGLIRRNGGIYAVLDDGIANTLKKEGKLIFLDESERKKEVVVEEKKTKNKKEVYPDDEDLLFPELKKAKEK